MTPEQVEEVESFWPWLRTVAAAMTTEDRVEELAQEAWLAVWLGAPKWSGSGSFPGWIRTCAKNRMLSVLRAEKSQIRDRRKTDLYGEFPESMEPLIHDTPNLWAYHESEITAAVSNLPDRDRDYVLRRFWNGEQFGRQEAQINRRWYKTIRPRLAAELAHLKDVA